MSEFEVPQLEGAFSRRQWKIGPIEVEILQRH
jgi:hypothetical protein